MKRVGAILAVLIVAVAPNAKAQSLPDYGLAISPAQARVLKARIVELSAQDNIKQRTLDAIARRLVEQPGASFDQILSDVDAKAQLVVELEAKNQSLSRTIATLRDPSVRDPASVALKKAIRAIAEGRLDDADRDYADVEKIRSDLSESAQQAWATAVSARSNNARLRLDYDLAIRLTQEAFEQETRRSRDRLWLFAQEEGKSFQEKGFPNYDLHALEESVRVFTTKALANASEDQEAGNWAITKLSLGQSLYFLGRYQEAMEAAGSALKIFLLAKEPHALAADLFIIGGSESNVGLKQKNVVLIKDAADALEAAARIHHAIDMGQWTTDEFELAFVYMDLGRVTNDASYYKKAVETFRASDTYQDGSFKPGTQQIVSGPDIVRALIEEGNLEQSAIPFEDGEAVARHIISDAQTYDMVPFVKTLQIDCLLGETLLGQGKFKQNQEILAASVKQLSSCFNDSDVSILPKARLRTDLADAELQLAKIDADQSLLIDAESQVRAALDQVEREEKDGDDVAAAIATRARLVLQDLAKQKLTSQIRNAGDRLHQAPGTVGDRSATSTQRP